MTGPAVVVGGFAELDIALALRRRAAIAITVVSKKTTVTYWLHHVPGGASPVLVRARA
jgi:hypothetical protein